MRSGIQILSDHPRFYLNDQCNRGTEWLRLTKKKIPLEGKFYSSEDSHHVSPWIALPGGRHSLGLGRHWHFFSVLFWVLNGLTYVTLLFATGQWRRLIPTSWTIFPEAWDDFLVYTTLHRPPLSAFHPYDALQQFAYASVVFVLAPLAILTGPAMSPAIDARFPWYTRLFGGRQKARSLHFLVLVSFLIFMVIHISLVCLVYFRRNIDNIVLGGEGKGANWAIVIAACGLAFIVAVHYAATLWSKKRPRRVQQATGSIIDNVIRLFLYRLKSRQSRLQKERSTTFWVNGYPPTDAKWGELAKNNFADYKLKVEGLVKTPLELTLDALKKMPKENNCTMHHCIQGWSAIGEWGGVPVREIFKLCNPLPQAKYLVFHSYQCDEQGREYYNTLDTTEAQYPQTILAYEMNGEALSTDHGAPLRLRVETQLGFKMTKWIRSIEFVEDFRSVGLGQGGYREDIEFFSRDAQI
jgi:methionine sulfoxide reductase catalytic subunit